MKRATKGGYCDEHYVSLPSQPAAETPGAVSHAEFTIERTAPLLFAVTTSTDDPTLVPPAPAAAAGAADPVPARGGKRVKLPSRNSHEYRLLMKIAKYEENHLPGMKPDRLTGNYESSIAKRLEKKGLIAITTGDELAPGKWWSLTSAAHDALRPRLSDAEMEGLKAVASMQGPVKDWDLYYGRTNSAKAKRTTLRRLADKGYLHQSRDEEYYKQPTTNGQRFIYTMTSLGENALYVAEIEPTH